MKDMNQIKRCLTQEIKHIRNENLAVENESNCWGYCMALCWVLGKERLYELIQDKYIK
jgi:hypothetical protein